MKKYIFLISIIILIISCGNLSKTNSKNVQFIQSFYDLKANGIDGEVIPMSDYIDKKILIVNVASKCGYTPQYKELQQLYNDYKDSLYILAFPSNDFLGQEPGSNQEIKTFCEVNFGVKFDVFEKISVTGKNIHPIYDWLSDESKNGWNNQSPAWNFSKYLINENGDLVGLWGPKTSPLSNDIVDKIVN
tara:strand:- start:645 stop:1211 length:567 start_codon:yes stop_codon:yes gene_type:complete